MALTAHKRQKFQRLNEVGGSRSSLQLADDHIGVLFDGIPRNLKLHVTGAHTIGKVDFLASLLALVLV